MAKAGKKWFYAQGQSAKARGLSFHHAPYYPMRNAMPYWAWLAYSNGYGDAR